MINGTRPPIDWRAFGEDFKALKRKHGLHMGDLARRFGVLASTISSIERGRPGELAAQPEAKAGSLAEAVGLLQRLVNAAHCDSLDESFDMTTVIVEADAFLALHGKGE